MKPGLYMLTDDLGIDPNNGDVVEVEGQDGVNIRIHHWRTGLRFLVRVGEGRRLVWLVNADLVRPGCRA